MKTVVILEKDEIKTLEVLLHDAAILIADDAETFALRNALLKIEEAIELLKEK